MAVYNTASYFIPFRLLMLGALLSIVLYVFLRYLFQRDRTALLYAIYSLLLTIYFIFQLSRFPEFSFLVIKYKPLRYFFDPNLSNLIFIFYFFFASSFLDASKRYPRLNHFIMSIIKIDLGIWCFCTLLLFIIPDSPLIPILNYIELVLLILLGIAGTIAIMRYWSYLEKIFFLGSSALIFSGLYTITLQILHASSGGTFQPVFDKSEMLVLCVLIEQFTFAAAISYKSKKEKNKVTALEKYWTKELENNRKLQDKLHTAMMKYQEQLELEVKERTDEIIRRSEELQAEKLQKTLEEYKRAALESELKALRTQINPHFLFNCMNILSSFVIRDQKEEALDFILKFSRLMRVVLENSSHHEVKIEKDIEALKLYIHLEAIRYDHSFKYIFDIDPVLLEDDYYIPPLLLQPYVENAIRHGLINKSSGERVLEISLKLQGKNIVCEIFDNGVGREKTLAMKTEPQEMQHHSMGMKVTESRISLLKELSHGIASVDVIDLNGSKTGTVIRILLPAK